MKLRYSPIVLSLAVLVGVPGAEAQPRSDGAPKARVKLLSSVDGVVAGEPLDVAVHFTIVDPWHIYWQNSGDSGQAPRIKWNLPTGFSAGDFQYPVPKRHTDPSGFITTNILEGDPSLIVRMTPPPSIESSSVTIKGDLKYLVCDEICLQETAQLELSLPVRSSMADVKNANEKVFEAARKAMPSTQSKYVSVSARVKPDVEKLKPGTVFELLVSVDVAEGYRVFAHEPGSKKVTGADLFVERIPGVFIDPAEHPQGTPRKHPKFGAVTEHAETFTVRVPGEVDVEGKPPFSFGGVLKYQACDVKGDCAAPDALAWSYDPFERAGDPPAPAHESERRVDALGTDDPGRERAGADFEQTDAKDSELSDNFAVSTGEGSPLDDLNGAAPTLSRGYTETSGGEAVPTSFLGWLVLAFLGGLILNVMPCVLPVISIKILSFVQQSTEDPARVVKLGLTFCLGMLLSFWVLAAVIIGLKEAGNQLGWGFQFQSPRFVIVMMALMFVFGLSLLGVFHITLPGATVSKLSAAEEHEGYLGAFMKGVLGTILATPCTAPYLGPALGVAFQSTSGELFAIFTAVGVGMASPFAILSLNPKWMKFLPKPGPWMEHFKQVMGFLLMGTVVWLMFTLGVQIGVPGLARTSGFLVALGFACWLLGRQTPITPTGRRLLAWTAAVGVSVFSWWFAFERTTDVETLIEHVRLAKVCPCETDLPDIAPEDWKRNIPWQAWTKGRPEYLASQGYTVYVDYTATWCATCQANKAATLESDRVRSLMRDQCVVPMKADFTLEDPDILQDLRRFDRSGVPLNVIFPAGSPEKPIVMPEQLVGRVGLVVDRLVEAGPTLACTRSPSAEVTGRASTSHSTINSASSLGAMNQR